MIDSLIQDIRVGLRVLAKEKGFCALAVAALALGISAVTTQFAIVNGVLMRGVGFPKPEELVDVQLADPTDFSPANFNARITTADFVDMKAGLKSFSAFSGYLNGSTVNMTNNGIPRRLQGGYVTYDFFKTLGVIPAQGRDFIPEDDRDGAAKNIILSDALWRTEFGSDANIIGRSVRVNGQTATIVGVMPKGFSFPANEQLWIPLNTEFPVKLRSDRTINTVNIIARLKEGVTMNEAEKEVDRLAKELVAQYPENKPFDRGYMRTLIEGITGPQVSGMLYVMMACCIGVLLIACFNVMNMQFARASMRSKELAVRSSLGATRIRLIRQMLTESFLLSSIGALVGVLISIWAIDWVDAALRNQQNPIPGWMVFRLDGTVLTMVVLATVLAAFVAGFVPAVMASRANPNSLLKEAGRGSTSRTVVVFTRGLVVLQILVTSVLLIAALLQVQSIVKQQNIEYGYKTDSILSARMGLMQGDYPTNEARVLFFEKLLRRLRVEPAFEASALSDRFQMVFNGNGPIEIEGREYKSDIDRPVANFERVTDGYFNTTGQQLLDGRDFTADDNDVRQPVAVINATFAKKFFGNESPIGRRFRTVGGNGTVFDPWRQIVGVTSDTRMLGPFPNKNDNAGYYVPHTGFAYGDGKPVINGLQFATVIVRPRGGIRPEAVEGNLRQAVASIDPNLPLYFVATPKTNIEGFTAQGRIVAIMFVAFGVIGLFLAAIGLYGVMSFAVNQRTQEFGIRMALGANARSIITMVLGQGGLQLIIGLALGLGFALTFSFFGAEAFASLLFETSPRDPLTYTAVALFMAVVALIAACVPALRASRVDPMTALRSE